MSDYSTFRKVSAETREIRLIGGPAHDEVHEVKKRAPITGQDGGPATADEYTYEKTDMVDSKGRKVFKYSP